MSVVVQSRVVEIGAARIQFEASGSKAGIAVDELRVDVIEGTLGIVENAAAPCRAEIVAGIGWSSGNGCVEGLVRTEVGLAGRRKKNLPRTWRSSCLRVSRDSHAG